MRVMVIMKANAASEAGQTPSQRVLEAMGHYNESLVNAGVMLAGEGLHPSVRAVRLVHERGHTGVVNGPFAPVEDLVAGFWLWQVRSMEEAIEWAKRCPNPDGDAFTLELRPVFETEDFGDELTPELRAQEERLREQVGQR